MLVMNLELSGMYISKRRHLNMSVDWEDKHRDGGLRFMSIVRKNWRI